MKARSFKRILAVLMVLVTFFASFCLDPQEAWAGEESKIAGVDYTRLGYGSEASCPVILKLGPFAIPGEMQAGNLRSRAEVNRCVRKVMDDYGINSKWLIKRQTHVAKLWDLYGVSYAEVAETLTLSAGGKVGTAIQALISAGTMEYNQSASPGDIINVALGSIAGLAVGALSLEGTVAYLAAVSVSAASLEIGKLTDALLQGENPTEVFEGLAEALEIADFYDRCRQQIKFLPSEDSARIVFDGKVAEFGGMDFLGIGGNTLCLSASGELRSDNPSARIWLDKSGYDRQRAFSGTYSGELEIEISYSLKPFDEGFMAKFVGETPFGNLEGQHYHDSYQPTVCKKTLKLSNVKLTIDAAKERYGNTKMYAIPLGGAVDETVFRLNHEVIIAPQEIFSVLGMDENGSWQYSFADGTIVTRLGFSGTLMDKRYAGLDLSAAEGMMNQHVVAPYTDLRYSMDLEGGQEGYGVDKDVFSMLSGTPVLVLLLNDAKYAAKE